MPPTFGPVAWLSPWFLISRLLDIIFFSDLILQFFLAYQTGDRHGGSKWVDDRRLIRRNYITSWFPLDLGTLVVPLSFDLYQAHGFDASVGDEDGAAVANLSILRVYTAPRLTL